MKKTMPSHPVLFAGMTDEEMNETCRALRSFEKTYEKGQIILHAGSITERFALVLEGSVTIESNDIWGSRTILSNVGKNQFFAETYALLKDEPLLVDVVANEPTRIRFFRIGSLDTLKSRREPWVLKLISNLLLISSQKNLHLSGRSFHTAPKTIRGRVMSYLNAVCLQRSATEFDIPFDRRQLADYLNLERTALSKELGKMQRDGLIRFRKNHFILLQKRY